jgi:hypothetical protein
MNCLTRVAISLVILIGTSIRCLANVIVVDSSGGGNFTEIQPAIDAASDGDTILVRTGVYARFRSNNRSLALVGDIGASVRVDGTIGVSNLAVEKLFVLQNMAILAPYPSVPGDQHGIQLNSNLGRIRIQHCSFEGAPAAQCAQVYLNGGDGIRSRDSIDLAFTSCVSHGGQSATDGNFNYGVGGTGVFGNASVLTIYDCGLFGGGGGQCYDGTTGGDGIYLLSSAFLFGSNYQAIGGNGSNSCSACGCSYGGWGGEGTRIFTSSVAYPLDAISQGGKGGYGNPGFGCTNTDGYPGQPYDVSADSTLSPIAGTARVMTASSPMHAGTVLNLGFHGVQGDSISLFASDSADARFLLEWSGTLLLDPTPPHGTVTSIGTVPSSGFLTFPLPVSDPGVPSKIMYLQPLFTDVNGHKVLGSPYTIVVLE